MTEQELEKVIHDYIMTLYKACYNGVLKVTKIGSSYRMSIAVPSYMHPTTISGDFSTDQQFLDYICSELKTRNYMRVYFYKVNRTKDISDK